MILVALESFELSPSMMQAHFTGKNVFRSWPEHCQIQAHFWLILLKKA